MRTWQVWLFLAGLLLASRTAAAQSDWARMVDFGTAARQDFTISLPEPPQIGRRSFLLSPFELGASAISPHFAATMAWYKTTLEDGNELAARLALGWSRDDPRLGEALRLTWMAANGNVISRRGNGLFRLEINSGGNWIRPIRCEMMVWPDGQREAITTCDDGVERSMVVPDTGILVFDHVEYRRIVSETPLAAEDMMLPGSDAPELDQLPTGGAALPDSSEMPVPVPAPAN